MFNGRFPGEPACARIDARGFDDGIWPPTRLRHRPPRVPPGRVFRLPGARPAGLARGEGVGEFDHPSGQVDDPGLPDRGALPPRLVRHEARRPGRDSRRVQAGPNERPGRPLLRAPAGPRLARRQAGDRPVDVAHLHEPPQRHPRDPHRSFAARRVLRQDRLARRLPVLRLVARILPPPGRRHPRRRHAAHLPDGRAAHVARPARRVPRAEVRPAPDQAGPEQARIPRGEPHAPRRLQHRTDEPPPRTARRAGHAS